MSNNARCLAIGFLSWVAFSSEAIAADSTSGSSASRNLHSFFEREWNYTMEQSPTWASSLGDRRWNDRWEDLSLTAIERRHAHDLEVRDQLRKFDRRKLGSDDQMNLDLFAYENELSLEEYTNRWFLLPLTHSEGIQTSDDLAQSLRFEEIKDFQDWVSRLRRFGTYMDQTIELLRRGIREHRVHPKIIMQRVPAQIAKQLPETPETSPFFKPFLTFPASFPSETRARLMDEAKAAIQEQVIPAFRRLQHAFTNEYLPACLDNVGIWQLPNGQETYSFFARKFTTTDLTPAEIHALGLSEVERIHGEMKRVMDRTGWKGSQADFFKRLRTSREFYCTSPEDLLQTYRALAKRIDPELLKISRHLPRAPYGVEAIPDAIAPDTTTAYYRVLAADGSRAGTYFVNLYKPETRAKFEMMALSLHEAVPGHHFQFAIAFEQTQQPSFRRYGGDRAYTAYVEGWALYAESLGEDMGLYDDPYAKFGQLTYEMWRAVRLVVDTGIHSMKWDRQKAIDYFMAHAAKSELDVTNEIDRYVSWPGQALAYKVGELKIKELRAQAKKQLGDRFDLRDFNDAFLKTGPIPLRLAQKNMEHWIQSEKSGGLRHEPLVH